MAMLVCPIHIESSRVQQLFGFLLKYGWFRQNGGVVESGAKSSSRHF